MYSHNKSTQYLRSCKAVLKMSALTYYTAKPGVMVYCAESVQYPVQLADMKSEGKDLYFKISMLNAHSFKKYESKSVGKQSAAEHTDTEKPSLPTQWTGIQT